MCIRDRNSDQVDEAQDKEIFIPSDDPFYWKVSEATRDYFAKNGINQNSDIDFFNSNRIYPDKSRFLTTSLFERKHLNGDVVKRDYLVYINSQGSVFCGPCKPFGGGVVCNRRI